MTTGSEYHEAEGPWGPEPTPEEHAEWKRLAAAENDRYFQVPARDEAEREAYDHIEQVEAEITEVLSGLTITAVIGAAEPELEAGS